MLPRPNPKRHLTMECGFSRAHHSRSYPLRVCARRANCLWQTALAILTVQSSGCAPPEAASPEPEVRSHARDATSRSARTILPCSGEVIEDVEPAPALGGDIGVQVRCKDDHLVVREWGPDWQDEWTVVREEAMQSWHALSQATTHAEHQQAVRRSSLPAVPRWSYGGGSCVCVWPGDIVGSHCWDAPCQPPSEPPVSAPENLPSRKLLPGPLRGSPVVR